MPDCYCLSAEVTNAAICVFGQHTFGFAIGNLIPLSLRNWTLQRKRRRHGRLGREETDLIGRTQFDWNQGARQSTQGVPEETRREVLVFLAFLKSRNAPSLPRGESLLPLDQTTWTEDWSSPEEDEAWKDL
jgi:hypothetical protein